MICPKTKSANHCLTELLPIYQNEHWTIRRWNDRSVDPPFHHIILKMDGFLEWRSTQWGQNPWLSRSYVNIFIHLLYWDSGGAKKILLGSPLIVRFLGPSAVLYARPLFSIKRRARKEIFVKLYKSYLLCFFDTHWIH